MLKFSPVHYHSAGNSFNVFLEFSFLVSLKFSFRILLFSYFISILASLASNTLLRRTWNI